jgi:hypothetical protein
VAKPGPNKSTVTIKAVMMEYSQHGFSFLQKRLAHVRWSEFVGSFMVMIGCFQIRLRRITTATILKHRRAFGFPTCDRKSKPPALRVIVDSEK